MCSTVVAMMLASVISHRHSDAILGVDLAHGRAATSEQSFGGAGGRHSAKMVTDGDDATFWRSRDGMTTGTIEIPLAGPRSVDHVVLMEPESHAGRVRRFSVQGRTVDGWTTLSGGTGIGRRSVREFPAVVANRMRVTIEQSVGEPALAHVGVHSGPPRVAIVAENLSFLDRTTAFLAADRDHAAIYFTLDGEAPDRTGERYRGGPIEIDRDLVLRAIAFEDRRPGLDSATASFVRFASDDAIEPAFELDHPALTPGIDLLTDSHSIQSGIVDRIAVSPSDREERRHVRFEGLLRIPRDGVFGMHFATEGDVTVTFLDSERVSWESSTSRRFLQRPFRSGWHRIRLDWSATGDDRLRTEIEGPRLPRRSIRVEDLAVDAEP